jgi:parvulin-like peptidyl-prolyl isomerase
MSVSIIYRLYQIVIFFTVAALCPGTHLAWSQDPGSVGNSGNQGPSQDDINRALEVGVPDDPATVVAVVGESRILAGDLVPRVDARLNEIISRAKQPPSDMEIQYIRSVIFRSLLNQSIQLKILRESFLLSQVATQTADKRRDAEKKLESRAVQMFQDSELPRLQKKYNVFTVTEVDQKLREKGGSYESTRLDFIDQMLAHFYRSEAIPRDPEIALVEIRNYYNDNIDQYQVKAQARWEQLTATYEKSGGRDQAIELITEMGREAYFGGSMQAVAKLKSHEPFAARGGVHDWTARGSLASSKLDDQIFSLPIGVMSEVIEDEIGMHIVRVLERKPAGVKSISELQEEIREKLKQQKIEAAIKKVTSEMTLRVAVWSIYHEDIPGALPLSDSQLARRRPDASK